MSHGITPSERFVSAFCERSFLRLWTHPNPRGKKGKELCDCLIVCGCHVVIISVKENAYKDTGDDTGRLRWEKMAIEKSASQIWGAERWLETVDEIQRVDGRRISLPQKSVRRYHRVSISLGGRGQVPIKWGDLGNGFVHVCDEFSVGAVFGALDTIIDFVRFLDASEKLVRSDVATVSDGGGIEDLVAFYLLNNYSFEFHPDLPDGPGMVVFDSGIWEDFHESPEYKQIQDEFKNSYVWDKLIELYADDLLSGGMFDMHSKQVTDNEMALVAMALQPRGHRAVLGEAFLEFLQRPEQKVASRVVGGFSETAFVFLAGSSSDRESRSQELVLRCLVIRGILEGVKTVVGVATDRPGTSSIGYSSEISYVHFPEWTKDLEERVEQIQARLGYFVDASWTKNQRFNVDL